MTSISATADWPRINRIFFPYAELKRNEIAAAGPRFVYYTTAETATSILRNRQMWMRSTNTMNDYMEVEHGLECLNAAYGGETGSGFRAALDASFPGLSDELRTDFNAWLPDIRGNTYMTCVSEHPADEDQHGRLSMWRAYGGQAGVALVINGAVMLRESHALGAYASPVAYLNPDTFAAGLGKVTQNIEREAEYVRTLGREVLKQVVFNMLRFAVLCTKHPGFHEEREWRILASPAMHPSPLVTRAIEVIRGTPQTVLKVDFKNQPDQDLVGLALPELLNRIIIGPCEFPLAILIAFRQLLLDAEVPDAEQKIVVSDIPLRQPSA